MILIIGGTGLTGSAAVREFVRQGTPARVLVRNRAKGAELGGVAGIEVVHGDLLDPETLGAVVHGVDKVMLISGADDHMVEAQLNMIDAAKAADVHHIVKVSGLGPELDSPFRFGRMHAEIERYLASSGVPWTFLRPSQFMQVYYREVPTMQARGVFAQPLGETLLAPVDVDDVAKVAYQVLHSDGNEGEHYELTGPEALHMTEVCAVLSEVIGKPITYMDIDPAVKMDQMIAAGISERFAKDLDDLFALRRAGGPESQPRIETFDRFGIRPTPFAEFAKRSAAIFRGETSAANLWASGWQTTAPA
jgi:uncharacterized protein YbjT (DUF2867 family)